MVLKLSVSNQILGAVELRDGKEGRKAVFLPPSHFKAQEGLAMSASEGCLNRAAGEKKTYGPVTGSSGFWGQAGAAWTLRRREFLYLENPCFVVTA